MTEFDHSLLPRSLTGPSAALSCMFERSIPKSLLDVGCGLGVWSKAALNLGVRDVIALDAAELQPSKLLIPAERFRQQTLSQRFSLGQKFDVALCLEVAEHLAEQHSDVLISNLVDHADLIYFSAACPGQDGQSHVNCQWPQYWQGLFNACSYVCDDAIRWKLWNLSSVEFYYRQNIFRARKSFELAGTEPRIAPVIHPEALNHRMEVRDFREHCLRQIEEGSQRVGWYLTTPPKAVVRKLSRRLSSG